MTALYLTDEELAATVTALRRLMVLALATISIWYSTSALSKPLGEFREMHPAALIDRD